MAKHATDLELEDFTYDDDGLPVPLPLAPRIKTVTLSSSKVTSNNNINGRERNVENTERRRKHRTVVDVSETNGSNLKTGDPRVRQKNRTHGGKRYQDHSPVNDIDIFNTSASALPDVENIRIGSDSDSQCKLRESSENIVFSKPLDDNLDEEIMCITLPSENDSGRSKRKRNRNKHKPTKEPKEQHKQDEDLPVVLRQPILRPHKYTDVEDWEGDLQAMFDINGEGYDVTLTPTQLVLSPMSSGTRRKTKRRGSGIFRSSSRNSLTKGSSLTLNLNNDGNEIVRLKDVYAARVKRRPSSNQSTTTVESDGICMGVTLYTYVKKNSNKLKLTQIILEHPSESLSIQWANRITSALKVFTNRPKRVKVILQPHAGKKLGAGLYRAHIMPIFKAAGVEGDLMEVKYNAHIKQEMIHMDLSEYDCIVCIGGDGTVREVASGLLTNTQAKHNLTTKKGFSPAPASIPIAIIATGTTNHIAYSVLGTEDPITGAIHAVLGHTHSVDVCSVYNEEKLMTWVFNSQYGFGGNVLEFADRYKVLGPKRAEAAFMKALTKSKLRPYECDIEYIPSANSASSHPNDGVVCVRGCTVCKTDLDTCSDVVEDYDALSHSSTSSTFMDLTEESPWRHCKGEYLNVGVFAIPGRANFAPQGLSKFAHLNDGCMDLVLVKNTDRKEFMRYLKRHAGSKNQMDLPFVETHRVKEIRFRPRLPKTWNYKDYNFSEIDYEMNKVEKQLKNRSKSMNEIAMYDDSDESDDSEDDDDSIDDGGTGNQSLRDDGDEVSDTESAQGCDSNRRKSSARKQSSTSVQPVTTPNPHRYRMTFTEMEILKRRRKQVKKAEKRKVKEQLKMKSRWNFDNEIQNIYLDIDIRVHQGLLRICGQGLSPDTEPEETKMSCLPAIVL